MFVEGSSTVQLIIKATVIIVVAIVKVVEMKLNYIAQIWVI